MSAVQMFQVFPAIPEELSFLEVLSRNLWWSWNHDAKALFRRADPEKWEKSGENPLAFSTMIGQDRLKELARDESFLAHQKRVRENFERLLGNGGPGLESPLGDGVVAYFSMEFGFHESMPLVAGGLGVLAGDHLKAASDIQLPMVAVGLLYRHGYFRQKLDHDGWQQEEYPEHNLYHLPVTRVLGDNGRPLLVCVGGPDGEICVAVWKLSVGRVPVFLLDTNVPENPPQLRDITSRLYAGEPHTRLLQELILGVGGMRALEAQGIHPRVCHMNEGHCAFLSLERLYQCMRRHNIELKTALQTVPRSMVFTTHTPVAAGHDEFPAYMVRPYLTPLARQLGTTGDEVLSWGQAEGSGPDGPLCMFILAMRMAQHINGVSRLHGRVARNMWSHVWPGIPEEEVPITHITNGIHPGTWISLENDQLFQGYLGSDWALKPYEPTAVSRVDAIYDDELWRAHEMARSRLIRYCRDRMVKQYSRRNAPQALVEEVATVLDQDVLTIAFARRFTTYKRAFLLFQDPNRLERLLNHPNHPVQILFAGKAHPKDNEGKDMIKSLVQAIRRPGLRHRVIFLEDYDMAIGRHLVQGADVWLNNPRRPLEACGTSGMKAALNGVLNVSVLDGWWAEGYDPSRGWAVGRGEEYKDHAYQDDTESQALYNVLENDVIPCFYERRESDIPMRWVQMMKESMKMALADYSSQHMVAQYWSSFYDPAANRGKDLLAHGAGEALRLVELHARLKALWPAIAISEPRRDRGGSLRVGESFLVTAEVFLGDLGPSEVSVELYYGELQSMDTLRAGQAIPMSVADDLGGNRFRYACTVECNGAGRYGFTARVLPAGDTHLRFSPGLITWA
ncbi:MAG: alpha-glucan family phosphorylase [Pseudomonadota bacterium]